MLHVAAGAAAAAAAAGVPITGASGSKLGALLAGSKKLMDEVEAAGEDVSTLRRLLDTFTGWIGGKGKGDIKAIKKELEELQQELRRLQRDNHETRRQAEERFTAVVAALEHTLQEQAQRIQMQQAMIGQQGTALAQLQAQQATINHLLAQLQAQQATINQLVTLVAMVVKELAEARGDRSVNGHAVLGDGRALPQGQRQGREESGAQEAPAWNAHLSAAWREQACRAVRDSFIPSVRSAMFDDAHFMANALTYCCDADLGQFALVFAYESRDPPESRCCVLTASVTDAGAMRLSCMSVRRLTPDEAASWRQMKVDRSDVLKEMSQRGHQCVEIFTSEGDIRPGEVVALINSKLSGGRLLA